MGEAVFVDTKYGKLKGVLERSFEGYNYYAYKGIPYAKPPIGQLRFMDPVPLELWSGVRDATDYGPQCCQMDSMSQSTRGEDDCLYLNIFVKTIKPDLKLPVMVWIHGGGFVVGSGGGLLYGPDYFLKKDIVLVTINYRLGVLGFLNFDDEVAPGNQGLKDQVAALRWVKENITNFSGDPNNVTIFGESAGGASVHYLTLSPLAKGLFHKAISQSGVACNSWACSATKYSSYKLCEVLGNNSKDPKVLVEFLRTIDCQKLVEAQQVIHKSCPKFHDIIPFGPTVDSKSIEPFLSIPVSEAMESGAHVPYMLGCNSREGIFHLLGLKQKDYDTLNNEFDKSLGPRVQELLRKNNITPNQLKNLYFDHKYITEKDTDKVVDLMGDLSFVEGIHRIVKCQVKYNSAPTYFYRFTYDKESSIIKLWSDTTMSGTSHFDEVQYLFSMQIYDILNIERPKPGSISYKIIEQMIELWVNFAKYGRPTPEVSDLIPTYWLPVTDDKIFRALNINENLRMEYIVPLEEQLSLGKYMKNKL
ncbi:esterase FE4-like [Copidosoma floridanum]|uniref:esterase FE4-like n=1 Tax=Copidosoma floridanum TaxID=29053 RepID=UPI000C6F7239|nr:esterase FE4-like [Copidosoma floridanum]